MMIFWLKRRNPISPFYGKKISFFVILSILILSGHDCNQWERPLPNIRLDFTAVEQEKVNILENQAELGFLVCDLEKGTVIYAKNPRVGFIPASTTKIATTVAALQVLGSNYRFKTQLAHTGPVKNGILNGNLYLKGSGDPRLLVSDLIPMLVAIERRGITKIQGKFILDDSALYNREMIDAKMGSAAAYNPGLSALSLHYNYIKARWIEKKIFNKFNKGRINNIRNRRRRIRKIHSRKTSDYLFFLTPELPIHQIQQSKSKLEDEKDFVYRLLAHKDIWFYSSDFLKKRSNRSTKFLPVRRPTLYTGHLLRKLAAIRGITMPYPEKGILPSLYFLLHIHKSPPLISIVESILNWSNNLMADLLIMVTAKKISGNRESLRRSAQIVAAYIKRRLPGVDWNNFHLVNGSGLTGENRISPEQMAALLIWAESRLYQKRSFMSLLPISGWQGGLRGRLFKPEVAFRVYAKTGTIFYAVSLAGFFYGRANQKLIFVQFYNNIKKRQMIDADNYSLSRRMKRDARSWIKRRKEEIDMRIERWISEDKEK